MGSTGWLSIVIICVVVFFLLLVLLVIIGAIALFFGRKQIQKRIYKYLKPDATTVQQDLDRLLLRFPDSSVDQIATNHVKEEAQFLAWVGLLTIIPLLGFVIDISYTTLRQMRMLHVITALYKNDRLDPEKLEIKYMGIVGGANLVVRLLVKGTTSEIPIGSAVINAFLNWFFTMQMGRAGIALNNERSLWAAAKVGAGEMKDKLLVARDAAREAVNRKSVRPLALSQLNERAIPASQLPAGHTEFIESHSHEYDQPVPSAEDGTPLIAT